MSAWEGCIESPVKGRSEKPRKTGVTMLLDKGLGLNATQDLADVLESCEGLPLDMFTSRDRELERSLARLIAFLRGQ